jgi:hypothetical protein
MTANALTIRVAMNKTFPHRPAGLPAVSKTATNHAI